MVANNPSTMDREVIAVAAVVLVVTMVAAVPTEAAEELVVEDRTTAVEEATRTATTIADLLLLGTVAHHQAGCRHRVWSMEDHHPRELQASAWADHHRRPLRTMAEAAGSTTLLATAAAREAPGTTVRRVHRQALMEAEAAMGRVHRLIDTAGSATGVTIAKCSCIMSHEGHPSRCRNLIYKTGRPRN